MELVYCLCCGTRTTEQMVDGVPRARCPNCDWVHYQDPKVAAGVILFDSQKRVLLVKRATPPVDTWTFPGGYVDRFEDPDKAACREVLEETGMTVRTTELLGIYRSQDSPVLLLVYLGEATPESAPPTALHECKDARYFTQEEIPWEQLSFETTLWALKDSVRTRAEASVD